MTPEKAKGLRGIASPGPWRADRYVYMDGQSVYDQNGYKIAEHMSGNDADLIAAAPELAELVAGLRYEYAVQVQRDGRWKYMSRVVPRWIETPLYAEWLGDLDEAEKHADHWRAQIDPYNARVVRRLVGDPEVTE